MLSKEDKQKSFFDPDQVCENLIDEDTFYHTLHKFGSAIISDEDFEPMYCEDNGRPSVPPAIMAKVLLLQRHDDVTDREAARRVRMDIGWKHALGVQVNWEGFNHSLLAHFRARLLAHNMEGSVFEMYTFDKQDCRECPLRSEYTSAKRGRTISLNYNEKKLQEDRAYQETDEFEETYSRRGACERKVYEVMRVHGMRQSRHMGKRKTEMQMKWTAAVVNLKRLPELIEETVQAVKQQVQYVLQATVRGSIPEMVPI